MACGPKGIAKEFLREAEKAYHAMGYAPGCDLFQSDDWTYLYHRYKAIIDKLQVMVESLPEGTAEAIRQARYGS